MRKRASAGKALGRWPLVTKGKHLPVDKTAAPSGGGSERVAQPTARSELVNFVRGQWRTKPALQRRALASQLPTSPEVGPLQGETYNGTNGVCVQTTILPRAHQYSGYRGLTTVRHCTGCRAMALPRRRHAIAVPGHTLLTEADTAEVEVLLVEA